MTIQVQDAYTYLDWAATAPLCEEASLAMRPYLEPDAANYRLGLNANSLHAPGRAAFEAMELARRQVAADLGASRPNEVVFTSGATESDNAAVLGIAQAESERRRRASGADFRGRVITTAIEHEAVAEPARRLAAQGFDVVFLKPDRQGVVAAQALAEALTPETLLVSVQTANGEVGSIQPVADMVRLAHEAGAYFHADATQSLGKMPLNVSEIGVDAASFSAHKIGGPKGVGLLYLKTRTPFQAQMLGGGQEDGRRSTTQNVCGIAGAAAALHAACERLETESARQIKLRDWLYDRLSACPGVRPTVQVKPGTRDYLPNIVHVLVDGFESETLVLRLDMKGFGVSGGSACSSHSLEPSHVLRSLGVSADDAYGALRVSIGHLTTQSDLERFACAFEECLK